MNLPSGWNDCDLEPRQWTQLALCLQADIARRLRCTESGRLSLIEWGQRYLPHYFQRPPSGMHRWLADRFDRMSIERGTKLNVVGPRGGAKSTLGTLAHVLRAALEGWEPYIWIVCDTKPQARGHLQNIKAELTANSRIATDYPQACGKTDVWRTYAIRLANGVTIEAFGAGQSLRGRRAGPHRPTLGVCDDLENDAHMQSANRRLSSRNWFEGTLLKAGTKLTNFVNLATALHREALALHLHRTPGWISHVFPAILRWPDNMSLWHAWEDIYCDLADLEHEARARQFYERHRAAMEAGALLLWPEEEDLYTLMRMRVEGGKAAFEREKQGVPLNPERCEWPESYFDERIWFDEWPTLFQTKVIALDPSKGREARRGDYSAYVLLGVASDGTLYVEADLARRPTPEMVATGVELCRTFLPQALAIETNQFQELLAAEFAEELVRQKLHFVQPWSMDNHVNKLVRIRRLGPYLAGRRLRFRNHSPGTRLLVEQLKDFPLGDHDDGPDALEMAIRLAGELLAPCDGDALGDRLPLEF